jgi:small subunit ribosomal protein S1
MTESFAELFEASQANLAKLKPGSIVSGVVVEVRGDVVVINAGLKSEGIVPIEQFRNDAGEIDVAEGDVVKVALDSLENGFGETVLSREKAKRAMVWDELEEALEKNETITGRISGKVKGGFTVDIKDVRAFLPGSLVDVRPVRDPAYLEGKELEFKLIKLDRKRNNVVVSRRAVVESEHSEEREQLMDKLQEGAILKGVVKNLTDYGAFVDLGGIDGLLHITDMAWKRVRHPSEVVNVGDELDVRVLKFDRERNRVSLGLKQLGEDPWDNIAVVTRPTAACSARSPTSPITAHSSRSSRASKVWCTSPRWIGPTRTSTRPRLCRSVTKSKSWSWTSTRSVAASRWA